jgi:DNA-binding GntR family transcriptional regulator
MRGEVAGLAARAKGVCMSSTTASAFQSDPPTRPGDDVIVADLGDGLLEVADYSSVDEVYIEILQRIVRGDFPSGTVLTSTRLATQLKVSRTPVVAAVDRLVADGLLIKVKNRRAIVRDGAEHWLSQVHQLREIVEPPAAALAATRISDEALENLEMLCNAAEPRRNEEWITASRRFDQALHLTVADSCGNLPLRKTIYKCWSFKQLVFDAGYDEPRLVETGYREHAAILQSLARHDSATASAAMLFHLRSASCIRADLGIS